MNKGALFQQLESHIKKQIANAEQARRDAQDEANRHKGRMQSRYDTFKEEAQQMAAAHELRKIELEKELSTLSGFVAVLDESKTGGAVKIGSLVVLETLEGQKQWRVLMSPVGGGIELVSDLRDKITVITPPAPLGQSILGKFGGEKIRLGLVGKTTEYAILEVI